MSDFKTLDDLKATEDLRGRRVLMRVDVNVPMDGERVSDTTRIERIRDGVLELADSGAKVVLLAHFGRPKGARVPEMSLERIVPAMSEVLGRPVSFSPRCIGDDAQEAVAAMEDGGILMVENTRFGPFFRVVGDRSTHFGLFDCAPASAADGEAMGSCC